MSYRKLIIERLQSRTDYRVMSEFGKLLTIQDVFNDLSKKLKYVPEENQKMILDNIDSLINSVNTSLSATRFMNAAEEAGYLAFEPYIIKNEYGTPTLVLAHNRFVQLFRGYYYQVSCTADGVGEYQRANFRVDDAHRLFDSCANDSKLLKILYYMDFIQACIGLDFFDEVFKGDETIFDEFMKQSTVDVFSNYDLTYEELVRTVVSEPTSLELGEPIVVYRLKATNTTDYCRIRVYSQTRIGVEIATEDAPVELIFTLPSWDDGLDIAEIVKQNHLDADDLKYLAECIKEHCVFGSLITFGLNSMGFVVNYLTAYPIKEAACTMRALNSPSVRAFNNLDNLITDLWMIFNKQDRQ